MQTAGRKATMNYPWLPFPLLSHAENLKSLTESELNPTEKVPVCFIFFFLAIPVAASPRGVGLTPLTKNSKENNQCNYNHVVAVYSHLTPLNLEPAVVTHMYFLFFLQNAMNLPPDKARLLRQYDNEKKWELICDQVSGNQDVVFFLAAIAVCVTHIFWKAQTGLDLGQFGQIGPCARRPPHWEGEQSAFSHSQYLAL